MGCRIEVVVDEVLVACVIAGCYGVVYPWMDCVIVCIYDYPPPLRNVAPVGSDCCFEVFISVYHCACEL